MNNTINIKISENAILAHSLYEVLYNHYTEDAGEIIFHSGKTACDISFLLKNPAVHCNLNFANSNVIENINSEWYDLLVNDETVNWTAFIEDILYYVSDYDSEYGYASTSSSIELLTNTGKVLMLANNYISGKTESPMDLLDIFCNTDYYDMGNATVETYKTNKSRFEVRSDDSKEFFENVEYFDGGYIEFVSEAFKYSFEFNSVAYTSDEVVFYDLDTNREYLNKLIIIPDNIISIELTQKGTHTVKHETLFEDCKYLLTTKDGARFIVNAYYLKE